MINKYILPSMTVAVVIMLSLAMVNLFKLSLPVTITTSARTSELAVVGEGKVNVVPDTEYISLGVGVNNGASVDAVQSTINQTNNKIISAMKNLGIDKKDIQTSNYSINPDYNEKGLKSDTFSGNVTIQIKVKNTGLASQVISESTKAGANEVQATRFSVERPEDYREQARQKAIKNAKDQAEKIAKELGIHLGKVTNIVESSAGGGVPMYAMKMDYAAGSAPQNPDIQAGNQTISSTVTLYFEKN